MSFVSVIIPYYKKINHIYKTLNSVLDQTYQNFEIILIYDDANLVELDMINEKFGKNRKIKIIKNYKNKGAGVSRNIGIEYSTGDYIAFLDADDFWYPKKLEKQLKFMNENKYDFTFCDYKKNFKDSIIEVKFSEKRINYKDLLKDCKIGLSTVILNKKIISNNFFPPLKTKEDYVAWLKITKSGIDAYNYPEILTVWNYSENSLSSNFFQKMSDGFKVFHFYQGFNYIKSIYYLILLSFKSIKRKI